MADIVQKLGFDAKSAVANLSKLTTKLLEANTAMKSLQSTSGSKSLDKVTKSTKTAGKAANDFTVSWKTMARVVQTQIIVRGLNAMIKELQEGIESARLLGLAVAEIQTISGGAVGTNAQLTAEIIKMSNALGTSAQVLAEGFYQTLSNQVVEAGEALNFTSEAAKLATVTSSETGDAVNALSSVLNSYSLSAAQAEHVSGTLLKTIELGRLRMSEIANIIGRVTPLTSKLGIAWEETAASIAVMTRQGVRADTAITQLRAVVTKLIKPTKEVQAIFHSWGVEDAPQAIATFGGLGGVLKKLSQETGGSTAAMVQLLRNVRAIAGQMGIMADEGDQLAEAMGLIENATLSATEAWEEFSKSDAQRLTVELNRVSNSATKLGTTVLPLVSNSLLLVNNTTVKLTDGFKVLTGQIGVAEIAANTLEANRLDALGKIKKRTKEFAEEQREGYKGVVEAAGKYYTFAQLEENKLARTRNDNIEMAAFGLEIASDNLLDFYKTNLDQITNFIKKADDLVRASFKKEAKFRAQKEKRQLDTQLENAVVIEDKIDILRKKSEAQREKTSKAFEKIGVTKESREEFDISVKLSSEYAKQIKDLAKEAEFFDIKAKAEERIIELIDLQEASHAKVRKIIKESLPDIKAHGKEWTKGVNELGNILKLQKEITDTGDIQSDDPKIRARATKAYRELADERTRIFAEAAKSSEFLQQFGLTTANFSLISAGLSQAFDQAVFDWDRISREARAEFAKGTWLIKVAIDPTGKAADAAEALDLKQLAGESIQAHQRRTDAKAVKSLQEQAELEKKRLDLQNRINAELKSQASLFEQMHKLTADFFPDTGFAKTAVELATLDLNTAKGKEKSLQIQNKLEANNKDLSFKAFEIATQINQQLAAGNIVRQTQIDQYATAVELAREQGQITGDLEALFSSFNKTLNKGVPLMGEMATLTKQLMTPEKLQAVKDYVDVLEDMAKAGLSQAEAAATTEEKFNNIKEILGNTVEPAEKTSKAAGETANSASSAALSTAAMGVSASVSLIPVNALAKAYGTLATNAERAAKAQSASGGAALAYHGGPMSRHFADGGAVGRGQDKVGAFLSKGETVVNSKQSARFFSELNAMNQGSQPVFREQGGPVTNVGDVNVTVNGGDSSQQTVREIGRALRREVKRGNIKLN
jgi:TP901 family phage tail tape measure protein